MTHRTVAILGALALVVILASAALARDMTGLSAQLTPEQGVVVKIICFLPGAGG